MSIHVGTRKRTGWAAIKGAAIVCALALVMPATATTLYPVINEQGGSQNNSTLQYDAGGNLLTTSQEQHSNYRNNNTLDTLLVGAGLSAIFGFSFSGGGGNGASLNTSPTGGSPFTSSVPSPRDNNPVIAQNNFSPLFTPSLDPQGNNVPEPGAISTLLSSGFCGLLLLKRSRRN